MKPLYVLLTTFVLSCLLLYFTQPTIDYRRAGRIAMAAMLCFTAIGHFVFSKGMAAMVPDFLPYKAELVFATGLLEIILATGLLFPQFKVPAAWILIVFLLLILPANIMAAVKQLNYQTGALDGPGLNYLWFRIPLQFFFIGWIYWSALKSPA